jgi:hypothetical protein
MYIKYITLLEVIKIPLEIRLLVIHCSSAPPLYHPLSNAVRLRLRLRVRLRLRFRFRLRLRLGLRVRLSRRGLSCKTAVHTTEHEAHHHVGHVGEQVAREAADARHGVGALDDGAVGDAVDTICVSS